MLAELCSSAVPSAVFWTFWVPTSPGLPLNDLRHRRHLVDEALAQLDDVGEFDLPGLDVEQLERRVFLLDAVLRPPDLARLQPVVAVFGLDVLHVDDDLRPGRHAGIVHHRPERAVQRRLRIADDRRHAVAEDRGLVLDEVEHRIDALAAVVGVEREFQNLALTEPDAGIDRHQRVDLRHLLQRLAGDAGRPSRPGCCIMYSAMSCMSCGSSGAVIFEDMVEIAGHLLGGGADVAQAAPDRPGAVVDGASCSSRRIASLSKPSRC